MKFGFYSCMSGMPWGGSEVLWQRVARMLQNEGHEVTANYKWWPHKAFQLEQIEKHGGTVWLRNQPPKPFFQRQTEVIKGLFGRNGKTSDWLECERPDAVLVTLGYHPDQIQIAEQCQKLGIPYGINIQCASNFFFIPGDRIDAYRNWYNNAEKVFFVSQENQLKLQNNIAMKFENAEIIANPFNVPHDSDPEWPEDTGEFRIAFVGRVHFQSKGQDIVVDVMKQPKWRNRNLKITFYGHDQGNKAQLEELIKLHGLEEQLVFGGYKKDVTDIWRENHALLLPSRYEGAPLVVIEAMICNRMAIVTDIGRNRELIDDNESGFIAPGATIELLDECLERAWAKRDQWEAIGQLAGQHIRERYPEDPVGEFKDKIKALVRTPVV
ncbi:MAG: glycosyltransferase family 4 protein [Planctomycetota bacterium]